MSAPARPVVDRFVEKFVVTDGCWEWLGGLNNMGYGIFYGAYIPEIQRKNRMRAHRWYAHRFSWTHFVGPIPDGMGVLHHCDNPKCVRPDHLFLGNQSDNALDCFAKGRGNRAFGERAATAVLTEKQVAEIRATFKRGDGDRMARKYGVTGSTIHSVVKRKTWKHI